MVTPKTWVFFCCSSLPRVSGKDEGGCSDGLVDGWPDAWVDSPRLRCMEIGM